MPNIGPGELILILIIAMVVIGPGRLPDVGAALGKSIREFRKASTDVAEATRIDTSPLPPATGTPAAATPAPTAAPAPTPAAVRPDADRVDRAAARSRPRPTPRSDDEPTNLPA